jgi:tRNA (guanine-N7-)-methyltransferase
VAAAGQPSGPPDRGRAGGLGAGPDGAARSFHGRRRGRRLRDYRAHLVETLLPLVAIRLAESGALEPTGLFPRPPRAVWLEIGFGAGEHLAWQAERHPDIGMIGCEPFTPGVSTLLAAVDAGGLDMIRIWPDDARPLIDRLPDAAIGRVFLLFADPWPKRRHWRRRFLQRETVAALARIMADGAELRVATDDAPLLDWSLSLLRGHDDFAWQAKGPADWRQRPEDWPQTRYEAKELHGRPYFLRFRRHARPPRGPTQ